MAMNAIDEYTRYLENLIIAQYRASGVFSHAPTVGDVREEFIRKLIEQRKHSFRAIKGQIALPSEKTLEQCDIAVQSKNSNCLDLGGQFIVNPVETAAIIEVKTSLSYSDCKKFNGIAQRVKDSIAEKDKQPLFGIFAFGLTATVKKINLLKRFGYEHDAAVGVYYRDKRKKLDYPQIDFIFCLDVNKDFEDAASGDEIYLQKAKENIKGKMSEYFYLEPLDHFKKFIELIDSLK